MIFDMDGTVSWNLPYPPTGTWLSLGEPAGAGGAGSSNWLDLRASKGQLADGRQLYMEFTLTTAFTGVAGTSGIMPQLLLGVAYADNTNLLSLQSNFLVPLWTGACILSNPAEYAFVRGMSITGGATTVTSANFFSSR